MRRLRDLLANSPTPAHRAPTRGVDASEEMWRFFRRFTRPGAPPLAPPAAEDDR